MAVSLSNSLTIFCSSKNKLKEFKKIRGFSQSDLAKALDITRQAVRGFESGKYTPSLEMA